MSSPSRERGEASRIAETPNVPMRLRKLVGSIVLLILLPIYVLFATALANVALPGTSGWTQAAYYVAAGLAWVPPAGLLVTWMVKPRPGELRNRS